MERNDGPAPSTLRFKQALAYTLEHLTALRCPFNQRPARAQLTSQGKEEHAVLMPMSALFRRRRQPRVVWNGVPCSDQFFSDLQHHQKRFLTLEQMNERHPRLLTKYSGFEVGEQHPRNTHVFSAVSFPKGWNDAGEHPLFGRVGDHPRGDLTEIGQRRASVEAKPSVRHGHIGANFVGKIAYAPVVGFSQKPKAPSF